MNGARNILRQKSRGEKGDGAKPVYKWDCVGGGGQSLDYVITGGGATRSKDFGYNCGTDWASVDMGKDWEIEIG